MVSWTSGDGLPPGLLPLCPCFCAVSVLKVCPFKKLGLCLFIVECWTFNNPHLQILSQLLSRGEGREGGRETYQPERDIHWLPPMHAPAGAGELATKGRALDRAANHRPRGPLADALTTERWPGRVQEFFYICGSEAAPLPFLFPPPPGELGSPLISLRAFLREEERLCPRTSIPASRLPGCCAAGLFVGNKRPSTSEHMLWTCSVCAHWPEGCFLSACSAGSCDMGLAWLFTPF